MKEALDGACIMCIFALIRMFMLVNAAKQLFLYEHSFPIRDYKLFAFQRRLNIDSSSQRFYRYFIRAQISGKFIEV